MMARISNSLVSLFWWLVLHVLIMINFIRFCFILLFGDLSVKVVSPRPATTAQTLGNNLDGDKVDDIGPNDSSNAASLLHCDSLPCQPPIPKAHTNPQTQHEPPYPAQIGPDTTPRPSVTQQHAAQPSAHMHNPLAHPADVSDHRFEREESHTEPYLTATDGGNERDTNEPPEDISYQSPFLSDGSPEDELQSVVPCWDLDDVIEEGSTCSRSSNPPSNVEMDVIMKVVQQAEDLFDTFAANKNQRLLQRAIHLLDHIIPLLCDDALLAGIMNMRASYLHWLFKQLQNVSFLDQSIDAFRNVFDVQAWGIVSRSETLVGCGQAFADRYAIVGNPEDLDRGIRLFREALEESVETTGRPPSVVAMLGHLLRQRWKQKWDDGDLNEAIDLLGEAVSLLTTEDPNLSNVQNELGVALCNRYKKLGKTSDLEEAIVHHRRVLLLPSYDHHDRPFHLNNLATAIITRYARLGNLLDLKEALDHLEEALLLLSGNDPDRPSILNNLATVLVRRYERLGNVSDLEDAITHHRGALSHRSGNHPDRPSSLVNLASALIKRYESLGDILDVDEAIVHHHEALLLLPGNHPNRPNAQIELGIALCHRYKKSGKTSDLEEAIVHHREALLLLSDNHPDRPSSLSSLATALVTRYGSLGDISDVEEAIAHQREALSRRSGNHPDRPSSLADLAGALIRRYERLENISDVEEAIIRLREALFFLSDSHPGRPSYVNSLATALNVRYQRSKNISDLEEAIGLLETACNTSHPDDPQQSGYIHNLANLLLKRMDDNDLNRAIHLYERALSLRSGDHPNRPTTLEHLGKALLKRQRNKFDIETGMRYIDEALSLFPTNSPDRQRVLLNFLIQFSGTADKMLLRDRCIEVAKLTPPEHADYSMMASLVAPILHDCHQTASELLTALGLNPSLNAEDATLALLRKGSQSHASPSTDQLEAACDWITFSEKFDRPRSLEMYGLMLEHLDLAVMRGSSLDVRRQELSDDSTLRLARHLVPDAVACAIEQGEIEMAVEFLERGRSILLTQLSNYRISSGLEAVAPDLAARFNSLSCKVESATLVGGKGLVDTEAVHMFEDPISRSERLRREWEKVVEEIRTLDGFQQFLRPASFVDLQKAAAQGPVILINISKLRSDAIIITVHNPPTVVPLPQATPDSVNFIVSSFKVGSEPYGPMRSLWEEVVEPIISTLETMHNGVPKSKRIWWCPTGPLTTLPLHAAGDYIENNGRRLPDLYISSYTSTLSALSRARQSRSDNSGIPSFLLVGQSHTPGLSRLPAVPDEVARIVERIPHATVIEDENGTRDTVLTLVTRHQWIHLSCHGKVTRKNPLQSHFSLHDGPLSLQDLIQKRLALAELAFLSCCHSASGDSTIPDESLHLAAGMQFAGFKSVVGTMWAMNDEVGPPLADEFYRRLLGRGKGDYRQSAKALNDSLKVLRPKKVPLRVWINFVHWGA